MLLFPCCFSKAPENDKALGTEGSWADSGIGLGGVAPEGRSREAVGWRSLCTPRVAVPRIYTHLRDTAGSVPDRSDKARTATKRVVTFRLSVCKNAIFVKRGKVKYLCICVKIYKTVHQMKKSILLHLNLRSKM